MNLKQLDEKLHRLLYEMSYDKSVAMSIVGSLSFAYTEHILKLALFGNDSKYTYDVLKWKKEVYNFIKKARKVGNLRKNKKLKPRFYMEDFFFGLLETEEEIIETINDSKEDFVEQGYTIPENIDYHNIFIKYNEFVSEILKNFYTITKDEVIKLEDDYIVGAGK